MQLFFIFLFFLFKQYFFLNICSKSRCNSHPSIVKIMTYDWSKCITWPKSHSLIGYFLYWHPLILSFLVWPRLLIEFSVNNSLTNQMQTLQGKVKYSTHLLSDEWRQPGKQRIKFNNLWQENYTFFGGKKVTQTKFLQNQKIHEACKVHTTSFWLKLCYVHLYLYVCTLYACFKSVKLYVYEFLFLNLTSKITDKSLIYKNNQASY